MPASVPSCSSPALEDPPDVWECSVQVPNSPRAVRIVRHAIRSALQVYGIAQGNADTAELLTSELVSNSVKHAESPVHVRVRTRDGILRVSVWDDHPELPDPLPLTSTDPFGRGLFLVRRLSDSWGRYPLNPTPGKVTWFELAT